MKKRKSPKRPGLLDRMVGRKFDVRKGDLNDRIVRGYKRSVRSA